MLDYAAARGCRVHVLLTKADKLTRNKASSAPAAADRQLGTAASVQLFSAQSGDGVDAAQATVAALLARRGP